MFATSSAAAQKQPTTINLCIRKAGPEKGMVRFSQSKRCKAGEMSVQVVADSKQGVAGIEESSGAPGATGPVGPTGPKGEQGAQGEKGDKGDQGDEGATGAQGVQGLQGPKGATGPQGTPGAKGATGANGATGLQGTKGATGVDGATGATGAKGDAGPAGATQYLRVSGTTSSHSGTDTKTVTVTCPEGRSVLSGGWTITTTGNAAEINVIQSQATSNTTWTVIAQEDSSPGSGGEGNWSIQAHAVCALVSS
ncbi:MAG TPA: hypothetical protein VHQ43_00100 [Solirubrobacterales bacterium]|nr:hypothetical protein [Solirubrobacterales bacterium]